MKLPQLRQRHPEFVYRDYDIKYHRQELNLSAHFVVEPNIEFRPQVSIQSIPSAIVRSIPSSVVYNLAFHLGLAEIPSYWKATCSSQIKIQAGNLDFFQLKWWKKFLIRGLGEFFFTNQIQFLSPGFLTLRAVEYQGFVYIPGKGMGPVSDDKVLDLLLGSPAVHAHTPMSSDGIVPA